MDEKREKTVAIGRVGELLTNKQIVSDVDTGKKVILKYLAKK